MRFFLQNNEVLHTGVVQPSTTQSVERVLSPGANYKLFFDVAAPKGKVADTISYTLCWDNAPENLIIDTIPETSFQDWDITINDSVGPNKLFFAFEPKNSDTVFNESFFTLMALSVHVELVDDMWVISLRIEQVDNNGNPI